MAVCNYSFKRQIYVFQDHPLNKNQCQSCEMCTIHVQQNIGLQQQLLKASQKIARLEKELEKINERWSNAFSICNTSDPKGMYIAD